MKIDDMMAEIQDAHTQHTEALSGIEELKKQMQIIQDKLDKMCPGKVVWKLDLSGIYENGVCSTPPPPNLALQYLLRFHLLLILLLFLFFFLLLLLLLLLMIVNICIIILTSSSSLLLFFIPIIISSRSSNDIIIHHLYSLLVLPQRLYMRVA